MTGSPKIKMRGTPRCVELREAPAHSLCATPSPATTAPAPASPPRVSRGVPAPRPPAPGTAPTPAATIRRCDRTACLGEPQTRPRAAPTIRARSPPGPNTRPTNKISPPPDNSPSITSELPPAPLLVDRTVRTEHRAPSTEHRAPSTEHRAPRKPCHHTRWQIQRDVRGHTTRPPELLGRPAAEQRRRPARRLIHAPTRPAPRTPREERTRTPHRPQGPYAAPHTTPPYRSPAPTRIRTESIRPSPPPRTAQQRTPQKQPYRKAPSTPTCCRQQPAHASSSSSPRLRSMLNSKPNELFPDFPGRAHFPPRPKPVHRSTDLRIPNHRMTEPSLPPATRLARCCRTKDHRPRSHPRPRSHTRPRPRPCPLPRP